MAVEIRNVSEHDGAHEISDYTVQVNGGPVLARFQHWRHADLAECLRRAAEAVDQANPPNPYARKEEQAHG